MITTYRLVCTTLTYAFAFSVLIFSYTHFSHLIEIRDYIGLPPFFLSTYISDALALVLLFALLLLWRLIKQGRTSPYDNCMFHGDCLMIFGFVLMVSVLIIMSHNLFSLSYGETAIISIVLFLLMDVSLCLFAYYHYRKDFFDSLLMLGMHGFYIGLILGVLFGSAFFIAACALYFCLIVLFVFVFMWFEYNAPNGA